MCVALAQLLISMALFVRGLRAFHPLPCLQSLCLHRPPSHPHARTHACRKPQARSLRPSHLPLSTSMAILSYPTLSRSSLPLRNPSPVFRFSFVPTPPHLENRLLDPPRRVGAELEPTLRVELLNGADEPQRSLLMHNRQTHGQMNEKDNASTGRGNFTNHRR